ncbi:MAG TPA: hypothetical protein VL068_06550 [Microthrixaceae bacterium]|nr:hypothetical protein [Microthrixaceae bacterium]
MSVEWEAVLDDLERSILEGSEFIAPECSEPMPAEFGPRLRSLLAFCDTRVAEVEVELDTTSEEMARLASHRRGNHFEMAGSTAGSAGGTTHVL